MHRLLRGPALPVDGDAGHALRQAGRQPGVPGDVEGLRADLGDAAHDHVVDRGGVHPGAVHQRPQGVRPEVDRVDPGQGPVPPADRGANRPGYERFRHHGLRLFRYKAHPHGTSDGAATGTPPEPATGVRGLSPGASRAPMSTAWRHAYASRHQIRCRRLEAVQTARPQEAAVTTGLILLVLIGAIIAYAWTRLRGKMKLNIKAKHWLGPILVVVIVGLMLYSTHTGH